MNVGQGTGGGQGTDGGDARGERTLFEALERINERPQPWSRTTIPALWTSADISEMLLRFHLDPGVDVASRRAESIAASLAWIIERFGIGEGTRVIDLGCGPGLYANPLARAGARVTGIDISERSLRHARAEAEREGLPVDYVLGDYLAWSASEPYDLALLIMCDFCALAPVDRGRLLANVRSLLTPRGSFLFDVYSLAAYETWDEQVAYGPGLMDGFWSARPYYGFLNTHKYDAHRLVLEKYVIVEADRSAEYLNWFTHFDPDGLRRELADAGMLLEEVLGDVAGVPYEASLPEFAVVARPAGAG